MIMLNQHTAKASMGLITSPIALLEVEDMEIKAQALGVEHFKCLENEVSVEKISDRAFLVSYVGSIVEEETNVDALYVVDGEVKAYMRD